jgi:copper chaperone NosL
MCDRHDHQRRGFLKMLGTLGMLSIAGGTKAAEAAPGVLIPGKGWVPTSGASCASDGTPLQFMPRRPPDSNPLHEELSKYPACPYCGMDRREWQHSRHLVQYDDDLVDGTCSIHCLAVSLSLNLDRGPKAIYATDFRAEEDLKPLIPVDQAVYLIGSNLQGTMSRRSKMAFSRKPAAKAAKAAHGGSIGTFDDAIREAYLDMAQDTRMIRKNRAERRRRMK